MTDEGTQHGRLVYRGAVPEHLNGPFVAPAIFADVHPASSLGQEEIFGPVLALIPVRDFDEALALANGTAYALTGGVYARSPANLRKATKEFRVGNLYLNRGISGALIAILYSSSSNIPNCARGWRTCGLRRRLPWR